MGRRKSALAIDIGLRLPHSQGTIDYLKRHSPELHLTLLKVNGKDEVDFSDIMILEESDSRGNYYSCSLCGMDKRYSGKFGHAKKHFESHPLNIEDILRASRIRGMDGFFKHPKRKYPA